MHPRQTEHCHHGVADELFGLAPERHELFDRDVVEPAEDFPRAFGVEPLGEHRRIDQIGEQDGDDLPLAGRGLLAHDRAAAGAEAGPVGQRRTTDAAGHVPRIGRIADTV